LSPACSLIELVGWDGMMWAGTARCVLREGPAPTCGQSPQILGIDRDENWWVGTGLFGDQWFLIFRPNATLHFILGYRKPSTALAFCLRRFAVERLAVDDHFFVGFVA